MGWPAQAIPVFRKFVSQACPGARCKMFGAMPSDFMLFEVSEQPDVEEDENHSVATDDASDTKWDVNHRSVHEKAGVHEGVFHGMYVCVQTCHVDCDLSICPWSRGYACKISTKIYDALSSPCPHRVRRLTTYLKTSEDACQLFFFRDCIPPVLSTG